MKVIPTTFIQALSQRKIKLHISADVNWKTEYSSANYSELFDLSEIAKSAGFDCWEEFLTKSSFEEVESIMNKSFHESANRDLPETDREKKQSPKGYVYMISNKRNGYTKIGFSKKPKFREKTLQSEEPEIEMIFKGTGTMEDEKSLHDEYCSKRVRGEWFDLSDNDKYKIMNQIGWSE